MHNVKDFLRGSLSFLLMMVLMAGVLLVNGLFWGGVL